jgi:putative ABC transport system ATP-binding protein
MSQEQIEQTSESNVILRCQNLKKVYKMGEVYVNALRGVDLTIKKGEFIAIMGPSGSGKTTLLNLLGGLDRPTEGFVEIAGKDISEMKDKELTKLRRHDIGFVFQTFNLLPVLTAFENIELPMVIAGVERKKREQRTLELLELVGLRDRKNHKPEELSGGERQRVAIARALANEPNIVFCDEPTGDLDSATADNIISLLKNISVTKNQTFVIVTHDRTVANRAEKIYQMRDGKIVNVIKNNTTKD